MRTLAPILTISVILAAAPGFSKELANDMQIRESLVGNTISGEENGKKYVEFLHPDGRILGEDREGRYTGRWQLNRGRICFTYDKEDGKMTDWDCPQVTLEGARITWTNDGERSSAILVPGNPKEF